jgi:hypothetical protein
VYKRQDLYPWPGKAWWVSGDFFVRYSAEDKFKLFETSKAKSRENYKEDYEEPNFPDWKLEPCDGNYSL